MSDLVNFKWPQGEDLSIELTYKEGDDKNMLPVNLAAGYALRMDAVLPSDKSVVFSASTEDDNVFLGTGQTGPNIIIDLDRALTLPGGAAYEALATTKGFNFDVFLRNTVTDKQVRVLKGSISIETSSTLWP